MNEEEWEAIKNNDSKYDGYFYYALSTTKTFCRPSCTSRTPNPKHVSIYKDVDLAIKAGFRPCTRCKPNLKEWEGYKQEVSKEVMKYIQEHYRNKFSLERMGESLHKNPHYIHRSFKVINGITPLKYLHKLRVKEAKILLNKTDLSITDIALEVGYNDSTQFSVKFKEITGLSPSKYRISL
ncbi:bifunctional transcriptional activator/DNA repair enzyme AdaA [Metabacillus halosaccharovorans]|uniref:bifunctional transcriptional activator/DNA repair enzyme AdaA n=1 Tax=Metabacillus halosaccharovorans TaxID=930124 RepID=UPI001C1FF0FD|nr:Ada metal-binding domain-containing protein [Metabacillus halosaccharovorans]MBU7592804.1 methylphosphotriester-DNA--protein-cysteine methyltransferase family protein [Metabacillus halosaccharovorans]